MNNKLYQFNPSDAYRLIDVTDKNGVSKVDSRVLYKERINCTCVNLHYVVISDDGKSILKMHFIENATGNYCNKELKTSIIETVIVGDIVKVITLNSIYLLKKIKCKEISNSKEKRLIELYLSDNATYMFVKGFFHNDEGKVLKLKGMVNVGNYSDSILLYIINDDGDYEDIVCRYFPSDDGKGLRFYSNVFVDYDYNLPMLIHNLGETDLKISYEIHGTVFHIKKGEAKHIIPYIPAGTNKEERINKT